MAKQKAKSTICDCVMLVPSSRKPQGEWRTGIKKHPYYSLWKNMRYRCKRGNRHEGNYSGRGIKICEQWLEDFRVFLSDIGERPSQKHSVDRIDNDKGYCPHNTRWATAYQQVMNSRTIKKKDGLPKWITLTRSNTFSVKRSVRGVMISAGNFKTIQQAKIAAGKLEEIYG